MTGAVPLGTQVLTRITSPLANQTTIPGVEIPQAQAPSIDALEADAALARTRVFETAFRLDTLADKSLPKRGPGLNADGSFLLSEIKVTAKPLVATGTEQPVVLKLKPVLAALEDKDQPLLNAVENSVCSSGERRNSFAPHCVS